jgi:hypothetical protein
MKPARILLISLGVLTVFALVTVGLAFNSGVQTWTAKKILTRQPSVNATLESVAIGLGRAEVKALRVEMNGAVLTVPSLTVELPIIAAGFAREVSVGKLTARGWTIDLSKTAAPPPASTSPINVAPTPDGAATPVAATPHSVVAANQASVARAFAGVLGQLRLPVDLALDGVDLEGEVILPPAPRGGPAVRARVTLVGGGLGVGKEGRFQLDLNATFTGENLAVNNVTLQSTLVAAMDSARTFSRFSAEPKAMAVGPQFPAGVTLFAVISAIRTPGGESYTLTVANSAQQLVSATADLAAANRTLGGSWKVDLRSADLAPFALGHALPMFAATGEGTFSSDTGFAEIRAHGQLDVKADQLGVLKSELAALGAIRVLAEFDLAQRGDSTRIDRLKAELSGARPVAALQSLQAFEFNAKTGELKVADPARELVAITLHGVPLAWAQPFLPGLTLTGSDLRGEFAATANNGGMALRPRVPLAISGLTLAQAGQPRLEAVDLALNVSADYAPAGWQAEVTSLTLQSAGTKLFALKAKAGQLAGKDQPIKTAGEWSSSLPALLAQPAAANVAGIVSGNASGSFVATVAAATSVELTLALTELVADPKFSREKLPAISVRVRADIGADGKIALNVPLLVTRDGRQSDFTLAGSLLQTKPVGLIVDARLTSSQVFVEDVQLLAAPFAGGDSVNPASAAQAAGRDAEPVWSGVSGQLALSLKKVVYAQKFEVADIGGTIRIDAGAVKLVGVRAGLGGGSELKLKGGLTFSPTAPEPYGVALDLDVTNFDPAPVLRALNPGQPPTVEGKFTVASKVTGNARNLGEIGKRAAGDFSLTSKSGVFRALSADISSKVATTTKTASTLATLGNLAGALTGRKDISDAASKAEAVASLSKMISAIEYDQLNVVFTRDAALNMTLKDFTLIAPELRLAGTGRIDAKAGLELAAQPLVMEFKLGARGTTGKLLKSLAALETEKPDDLGYFRSNLPLRVTGSLGKPDTSELQSALVKLAYEKSGAGDLLNRFLGGK